MSARGLSREGLDRLHDVMAGYVERRDLPAGATALRVLDPSVGGWWNTPPAMANAAGMLVSTLDDFWAFVSMLLAGGCATAGKYCHPRRWR